NVRWRSLRGWGALSWGARCSRRDRSAPPSSACRTTPSTDRVLPARVSQPSSRGSTPPSPPTRCPPLPAPTPRPRPPATEARWPGGVVAGAPGIDIAKALVLKSRDGAATTTISGAGGHCLPTSCPGGPVQLVTLSASGVTIDGFKILETDPTVNLITADGDA